MHTQLHKTETKINKKKINKTKYAKTKSTEMNSLQKYHGVCFMAAKYSRACGLP